MSRKRRGKVWPSPERAKQLAELAALSKTATEALKQVRAKLASEA